MRTLRVVETVRRFMAAYAPKGESGVVAVSGGADSVALLRGLVEAQTGTPIVAHFDHRLRGQESVADAAFVRELAGRSGLAFRLGEADVAAIAASTGENLEATARQLRYAWFRQVAAEVGASWVATGHTADDQAETVLHRLIRGTGLPGLRGISASRGLDEPTCPGKVDTVLLRPLLTVTRADIIAFLDSLGQPFREDSSNADPRFTRNRIRAELLPLLKTFNPDVVAALGRLAGQASEAHDLIAEQARQLLTRIERPRAGASVILEAGELVAAPPLIIRAALRLVWEREDWPLGEMRHDHWNRLIEIAGRDAAGGDFPGGISARRRGRVVQLGREL
jgi:tRNA(Ile)-lysidine synthase